MPSTFLIENGSGYNPADADDVLIIEDWFAIYDWYSGKNKTELTDEEIYDLGVRTTKEIFYRWKYTFKIEKMSREQIDYMNSLLRTIALEILDVPPPHGKDIFSGRQKAIVTNQSFAFPDVYLLQQNKIPFGYIRFGPLPSDPKKPNLAWKFGQNRIMLNDDTFEDYKHLHFVSTEEKEKRWADSKEFYMFPIREFFPLFDKESEIVSGAGPVLLDESGCLIKNSIIEKKKVQQGATGESQHTSTKLNDESFLI